MLNIENLNKKYYPGDKFNGTKRFYQWILEQVNTNSIVLDVGAGQGDLEPIKDLHGKAKKVIGVDIDPIVLTNKNLDEKHIIKNNKYPLANNSIDIAYSDYVFEHIENPSSFFKEIHRVLKPDGSLFFRTPNLCHYTSILSSISPHRFHDRIVTKAKKISGVLAKTYPAFYKINTKKSITKYGQSAGFNNIQIEYVECEPVYLQFDPIAYYIGIGYERTVNKVGLLKCLRANIFGKLIKK